jgi:XTP/dITP diphosphohydrolase
MVSDLTALPADEAPEETGTTFFENAAIKAVAGSRRVKGWVLSDDSGLEVDLLDGAPGVYSAVYAGPTATDAENRAKLKRALANKGVTSPTSARFRCVMAIARDGEVIGQFEGAVEGMVCAEERGEGGFGYDALFIPEGYDHTFAELPPAVKNALSHRSRALAGVIEFLSTGQQAL